MNQGTEKINKDIVTGGGSSGDSSLIYGQFALCTSELICLLLYFIYWFRTVNMFEPKGVQKCLNL